MYPELHNAKTNERNGLTFCELITALLIEGRVQYCKVKKKKKRNGGLS